MSKNNISFILHKPQLSENIGACARAIKNFNFKKLVLVNPKPIFPNDKILATSVGAKNIINRSKVYGNIEEGLSDIDIVIATSATFRNKKLGTYGNISNFSFYYAHHLSTIEGGMVCTNSRSIYEKIRNARGWMTGRAEYLTTQ